jgi:hypothetical protein
MKAAPAFSGRENDVDFMPLLVFLLPLLHPTANQLWTLKHEIQLLLLLGLAMIVLNGQKIIQRLKKTQEKQPQCVPVILGWH